LTEQPADQGSVHIPVMADEVVAALAPAPGRQYVDATLGGGGHAERILEASDPDGRLLGLDADGAAIARVRGRLGARYGDRLELRQANFRELRSVAADAGFGAVDGCLFDLGLSSFQLADTERGFGFRTGGPLDMRFDTGRGVPASELLATLDIDELTAVFRRYGEEPFAGRIARAIVESRRTAPVRTAEDLAALASTRPPVSSRRCGSPSTRSWMPCRQASRPPWTCSGRAAGSWSSATTRSRTASSSASSRLSAAGASARRSRRCASAVASRACAS
jgi:16S rRNA (cytosine1402-N4)-methyltransferase